MTPYEIDLLLWYYARAEDHPDVERQPPIFQPTLEAFIAAQVLEPEQGWDGTGPAYKLTARGRAYCAALQRVPLPESTWIINWPTDGFVQ
jgi:hypothetical protein